MAPRAHRSVTHKFHQRRDTIVRAAVEVLNHKGVRGMTLADVAAKIDLVPTAVMYYFRKKEDFAAACFHKAIEQYESMIAQASDGIADSSLRPVDAAIAAQMITALINAAAEVHNWAPGISQQNIARAYARPLFHGVLSS